MIKGYSKRYQPRQSIGILCRRITIIGSAVIYLFETFIITGTYIAFTVLEVFEFFYLLPFEGVNCPDGARQRYTIF